MSTDIHTAKGHQNTGNFNYIYKGRDEMEKISQAYSSYFKKNDATRISLAKEITNAYYDLATDLYEYGWGQSFHFARYFKGEGFYQSLARHEHYLAHMIGIRSGKSVLDVGCGVGGPAREIGRFTMANITGINNNDYQIARARLLTEKAGLSSLIKYEKGDFMNMPFDNNTFDYIYSIEATCHASNFEKVYKEIYRVLKPGGKFGVYEWCLTDKFDPENKEHKAIARQIEVGNGIAKMLTTQDCLSAFKTVGFIIESVEDLAKTDTSNIAWYYPLEGNLRNCQTFWDYLTCFRMTMLGKFITQSSLWLMESVGLTAKGTYDIGKKLCIASDGLVAGAKLGIFTPMFLVVAQKPQL